MVVVFFLAESTISCLAADRTLFYLFIAADRTMCCLAAFFCFFFCFLQQREPNVV